MVGLAVPDLSVPQVQQEPLAGRPTPRLPEGVGAEAFGSNIGAGARALGDAQIAKEKKAQLEADRTVVTEAQSNLENSLVALTHDPKTGALTRQGKDAMNLGPQYLPQYDAKVAEIAGTLTNERQTQAFQQAAEQRRNALVQTLDTHEFQQTQEYQKQVDAKGVQSAITLGASNYTSPQAQMQARHDIEAIVRNQADRAGLHDETAVQEAVDQHVSQLHASTVDQMLADDRPQMAEKYFEANRAELGEHALRLHNQIQAALHKDDDLNRMAIAEKVQDASRAGLMGLPIPPGAMPSRSEVMAAFPKDGDRRYRSLQQDINTGSTIKLFNSMSPQQIADEVKKATPTQGGFGVAGDIERADMMQRAAQHSIAERQKDPAGFVVNQGLGWQPLNLQNPQATAQELQRRVATAPEVSAKLGVSVPLLSKDEAASVGKTLDTMSPAARTQAIGSLRASLPNDSAYFDLMGQVMPHSPVSAVIGLKIGQAKPGGSPVWFDPRFAQGPEAVQTILSGEQLLNPQGPQKAGEEKTGFKGGFAMPPPAKLQDAFARNTDDLFRNRPEMAETYFAAFRAAYAGLAAKDGDTKGALDYSRAEQALKLAVGNTSKFNGQYVGVPAGMDPGRFEGLASNVVARNAAAWGAPPDWQKRIGGYRLEELGPVGSGRYVLTNGNGLITRPDGSGRPFTIDLRGQYDPAQGAVGAPQDVQRNGPSGIAAPGMVEPATIKNLYDRPVLHNADGSVSTTLSISIGTDKGETLIPTVVDGKKLTHEQAIAHYRKTGEHLGVFDTAAHADAYAESLHNEQARRMGLQLPTL